MPTSSRQASGLLRRGLQGGAQRFQHVGAARTPVGAVAVLGDLVARARDHKGGDGADVELVGAVAAGADDVDQHIVACLERHLHGAARHGAGAAGDLVDRLALHAQRGQEGADLGIACLARHDLGHGRVDLLRWTDFAGQTSC